ncbi:hypothetical protein CDL15_Pgr007591 [Punica granatum]|uniref:Uncharacterized protein n=1 Tax=Punica granatum TaxID=22663 RepID=A0A218X9D3_PUNGR|nr:hypothetical protein CDL15_Pgr007591 [Punica granatum]
MQEHIEGFLGRTSWKGKVIGLDMGSTTARGAGPPVGRQLHNAPWVESLHPDCLMYVHGATQQFNASVMEWGGARGEEAEGEADE